MNNIWTMLSQMTDYVLGAAKRIFGPNDDNYPNIGIQPFTGDPYRKKAAHTW